MKPKKIPRPSTNHVDKMINGLLCELSKYKHFSKKEMEIYYFSKRLRTFIPIYEAFIKQTSKDVLNAASSFNNFKRLNKKK